MNDLVEQYNSISDVLDKHAPVIEKTIIVRNKTPWTRNDIKEDKKLKHKLESKFQKTRSNTDYQNFKEQRDKYNDKLRQLRGKNIKNMIDKNRHDPNVRYTEFKKQTNKATKNPLPK